ncbi:copper resistance protein CopC [Natronococcus sp. JC468]|uniref:copper resistance CopC/CopD family protein n=1 Tax=Natronococcus sp. JC468 TaxID=1961921 RepID=UPI00143A4175|nr:FixH family protein [Natronococcus sp. JC468]NKE34819.1 copper resistance protein CopC [Natronococcus sp. JC468]
MSPPGSLGRGRGRSTRARALLALALAALAFASVAMPVAAHAYLSDSAPANGERVETAPDAVTLSFSGDGVQVADVAVIGPDGEDVSAEAEIDTDAARTVRVPIEDAADGDAAEGMYTVEWEILADDGHAVTGSFVFSVGDEPLDRDAVLEAYEGDGAADESAAPGETVAKGVLLVALVALVGGPVTAALAVYPAADHSGSFARSIDRRLARLFAGTGVVLFGSVLGLGLARSTSIGPLSPATLVEFTGTPLGRAWLAQLALALALLVALALGVTGALSRRLRLGSTLVGALGVGATASWTSHSATAIDRLQGTAVDFAHVAGAGLWLGGLIVLALAVPAALRDSEPTDRATIAAETVRRYSLLALSGVTLAGATGLALAAWHVPDLEALRASLYGGSLSAKTLLVLLALGLGGITRFVLLRRLESAEPTALFVRAVRLEVAVLVLAVLLSGVLTSVPTAAVVDEGDGLETATIEREGDVDVELTAVPAGDGDSDRLLVRGGDPVVFEVAFRNADGESLESERTVRLLADAEAGTTFEVDLEETEDGTYTTVRTLPAEGDWRLRITGEPDGEYASEWFDASVVAEGDGRDHDAHGDDQDAAPESDSAFATLLQFGAVAVAVVGSVAVAIEAVRFRDRDP